MVWDGSSIMRSCLPVQPNYYMRVLELVFGGRFTFSWSNVCWGHVRIGFCHLLKSEAELFRVGLSADLKLGTDRNVDLSARPLTVQYLFPYLNKPDPTACSQVLLLFCIGKGCLKKKTFFKRFVALILTYPKIEGSSELIPTACWGSRVQSPVLLIPPIKMNLK